MGPRPRMLTIPRAYEVFADHGRMLPPMLARRSTASAATAQPNGEIRALQQPAAERRSSPRPWHLDPAAEEQQGS
jgi:hypothetical protein